MINVICRANYTFGKNPQSQEKWLQGGNQKGSLGGPNSDSLPLPSPGPPSFWLSRPHSVPSTLQGTCLPRRRHRWWSRCQKWCCPSPVPALCQKHIRRSLNWLMDLYWFAGDIELRESLYIYYISIHILYIHNLHCLPTKEHLETWKYLRIDFQPCSSLIFISDWQHLPQVKSDEAKVIVLVQAVIILKWLSGPNCRNPSPELAQNNATNSTRWSAGGLFWSPLGESGPTLSPEQ